MLEHDRVVKGHSMWCWGQHIARCGEQYIEEQPPLCGGILEGPRKATLMFIYQDTHHAAWPQQSSQSSNLTLET